MQAELTSYEANYKIHYRSCQILHFKPLHDCSRCVDHISHFNITSLVGAGVGVT